jgi:hypothetical protein
MYQLCTNIVSTTHQLCPINMYQHHQLYTSCMCQLMYPSCTLTKIAHEFHHPNMICNFVIDMVYMITYLQTFFTFKQEIMCPNSLPSSIPKRLFLGFIEISNFLHFSNTRPRCLKCSSSDWENTVTSSI